MVNKTNSATEDWVAKIRAIGIDTNAMGRGHFSIKALKTLSVQAKLHGEMEIWIAEPVIWEWAQHLHEARGKFNDQASILNKAGYEISHQPAELASALDYVESEVKSLGPHVSILPINEVASDALKDQILLRAPGRQRETKAKEGRVKTGAADSAIYRAYHQRAGGQADEYVILSGDKDLKSALDEWKYSVKSFSETRPLQEQLFKMRPAPDALVKSCVLHLMNHLEDLKMESFEAKLYRIPGDPISSLTALGQRYLAGFYNVRVDPVAGLVLADTCLVTNVLTPSFLWISADEVEILGGQQDLHQHASVYGEVRFEISDLGIKSVELVEVKEVEIAQLSDAVNADEMLLILLENLEIVPGLEHLGMESSPYIEQHRSLVLGGETADFEYRGSFNDVQQLIVAFEDAQIAVWGRDETANYPVEEFEGVNVAELFTDSDVVPANPKMALNVFLMSRLYK